MPILNVIDKTIVEAKDFTTGSSDLVLQIPLTSGETIQFTAETQFFTPRLIATGRSDILGLPSESMVERTANNIPVVKMPIGAVDITTPQYYPNSVVRDMYQVVPIDNYFQELTDDLALPEDPTLQTLREQRDAALQAALALDDLNAAIDSGNPDAIAETNEAINTALDEGFASAINAQDPNPAEVLTAEEADELGALDFAGLTDDYGETDGAQDIINPLPEILEEDLIQTIPKVAGKVKGTEIINQAISLLNSGIQKVEDSTQQGVDQSGNCEYITVAKGKKGFLGVGKKSERKVKRKDIENKIKKIDEEIAKQNAITGPIPGYGKKKQKVNIFSKAAGAIVKFASKAGPIGSLLGAVIAAPLIPGAAVESLLGKKTVGMNKNEILLSLESAKKKLQDILAKDC
jgi:hypothetical protein